MYLTIYFFTFSRKPSFPRSLGEIASDQHPKASWWRRRKSPSFVPIHVADFVVFHESRKTLSRWRASKHVRWIPPLGTMTVGGNSDTANRRSLRGSSRSVLQHLHLQPGNCSVSEGFFQTYVSILWHSAAVVCWPFCFYSKDTTGRLQSQNEPNPTFRSAVNGSRTAQDKRQPCWTLAIPA